MGKRRAGDQNGVHRLLVHLDEQPVDQRLMFGLTALAHEMLAKMPVGGMENPHWEVNCWGGIFGTFTLSRESANSDAIITP